MTPDLERLARLVLRTANRTQAKGSTARIIVPRAPELADELDRERGVTPTDEDLLSAEEYLEEHGYLAPTDIGLTRGTFTITPAGLRWIGGAPNVALGASPAAGEGPHGAEHRPGSGSRGEDSGVGTDAPGGRSGGERGSRRPWWRRALGRLRRS